MKQDRREKGIGMLDIVSENKRKFNNTATTFQRVFNVPLHRFWHPLFGFDVVKFDEYVKPQVSESTSEAITRIYGQSSVKIVMDLL